METKRDSLRKELNNCLSDLAQVSGDARQLIQNRIDEINQQLLDLPEAKTSHLKIGNLYSYRTFEWRSQFGDYNKAKVRNVGNEVEISIEQTGHNKQRSKYISFVLPVEAFEEFVKAVTTPFVPGSAD